MLLSWNCPSFVIRHKRYTKELSFWRRDPTSTLMWFASYFLNSTSHLLLCFLVPFPLSSPPPLQFFTFIHIVSFTQSGCDIFAVSYLLGGFRGYKLGIVDVWTHVTVRLHITLFTLDPHKIWSSLGIGKCGSRGRPNRTNPNRRYILMNYEAKSPYKQSDGRWVTLDWNTPCYTEKRMVKLEGQSVPPMTNILVQTPRAPEPMVVMTHSLNTQLSCRPLYPRRYNALKRLYIPTLVGMY